MQCTVNEQSQPAEALAVQEMNFGRPMEGLEILPFSIVLPAGEFLALSTSLYQEYADAERTDEPFYRYGSNELHDSWHRQGYPNLPTLLSRQPLLLEYLIRQVFGVPLLRAAFPAVAGRTRFVLSSLHAVQVAEQVSVSGLCWRIPGRS